VEAVGDACRGDGSEVAAPLARDASSHVPNALTRWDLVDGTSMSNVWAWLADGRVLVASTHQAILAIPVSDSSRVGHAKLQS